MDDRWQDRDQRSGQDNRREGQQEGVEDLRPPNEVSNTVPQVGKYHPRRGSTLAIRGQVSDNG